MRGSRSAARLAALAAFAALPLALPSSWRHRLAGLPSLTPRALAAARAALVRWEIIAASCSATAARMVRRLAWGKSTATKSTPLSISLEMKATLRASRSSWATTRVAPYRRHRPVQLGPVVPLAALDLGHLVGRGPAPAVEVAPDRFPLSLQPKAG